jgi:hypothetical protein
MASHRSATFEDVPYVEPNPLPSSIPKVDEIGATSAPLKSASFAIGEYCKEVNGTWTRIEGQQKPVSAPEAVPMLTCDLCFVPAQSNRGLHALQAGKQGSRTLLERGAQGYPVRAGVVSCRALTCWTGEAAQVLIYAFFHLIFDRSSPLSSALNRHPHLRRIFVCDIIG